MRGAGCRTCNNTGYKGRTGVHELLVGTREVQQLIYDKRELSDIREQAIKDGMTTLKQDGIMKILKDAGTGFALPSRTVYNTTDSGPDTGCRKAQQEQV